MKTTIEMAREANLPACHTTHPKALERFAALVRADERDRAMRENAYVLAEREACAKVAEMTPCQFDDYKRIAAVIRARSNT